ncbi:MAG TPA: fatty acid--CoA ligase [Thermoanaerobaculia bacterium]|nr:fatty acid--CoA ligase [Thermoanaerobaculia bacterium]
MAISNLADLARTHARERGDQPALTFRDETWTYARLDADSSRIAQGLRAAGVEPQDRVAFLDKNAPEYFTFLLGAGKVNAVTVAVNWRLTPAEMEYILEHAEAKVLLVGHEFLPHLTEMRLPTVRQVVVLGAGELPSGAAPLASWMAGFPPSDPGADPAPDDTCYQLYTSGTTGLPKGVELTNRNFFSMLPAGSREWGFDAASVNLVAMPLFHIAGSGWGVVALYNGAHSILLREVDPAEILRVIARYRITIGLLVPAALQIVLQTPGVETTDFSSLRTMVYGASPITEAVLVRAMRTMGCGFMQAYGLTETTGGVTILRPEDHDPDGPRAKLLRSAGQPWGDVELRVVDPETLADLPDGQVGEILVRSVQNMKGYWKMPEASAQAYLEGGWLRTGDAGYLEDGYLYIHDRVKDMIISGGENIYPAEVENVLMSHPAVADCAVIGVPSERWGETVKALVVPATGADLDAQDLIAYCRERLAHYKCPTSVDWIERVPRNPSGKILKTELRQPYWKGERRFVG